jgi:hypothetical protein
MNSDELTKILQGYIREGKNRLENELAGTRGAIDIISKEKVKKFIKDMDRGLSPQEREHLSASFVISMYQAFCYGYSLGRLEGEKNVKADL